MTVCVLVAGLFVFWVIVASITCRVTFLADAGRQWFATTEAIERIEIELKHQFDAELAKKLLDLQQKEARYAYQLTTRWCIALIAALACSIAMVIIAMEAPR